MDSILLIESRFEEAHPRFFDDLCATRDTGPLRRFALRWVGDPRPWARGMLRDYIADGCTRPGHRCLVKALYKAVEAADDRELLGRFMAVFDRWAPRTLREVEYWDWRVGAMTTTALLQADPQVPASVVRAEKLGQFTRRTRLYLARRALRTLRHLGFRDLTAYREAAAAALRLYQDEHLQTPERLLDAWGLHHLLYGRSPVLNRRVTGTVVRSGRALAELEPAPLHPTAWAEAAGAPVLLGLLPEADAGIVRGWALTLLRRHHAEVLATLDFASCRALLLSPYEEAQQVGAERLPHLPDLGRLPVAQWLDLLNARGPVAVQAVVLLASHWVDPQRLSLAECIRIARLPAAPVAELGLGWARAIGIHGLAALEAALPLGGARVETVRTAAADWLAATLLTSTHATPLHVRELIDAPHADVRARGLTLLDHERFRDADVLWLALPETTFADVRRHLLRHLKARRLTVDAQRQVWADTLLALGSGGRARDAALRQIGHRLEHHPAEAPGLLRLLAVALRGVSAPDQRRALAVLAQALVRRPELRPAVAAHLPEIGLFPEAA